jgi:hypothetical protein
MIEDLLRNRKTSHSKELPLVIKKKCSALPNYIANRRMVYLRKTYRRFKDLLQICKVSKYSGKLGLSKKREIKINSKMYHNLNSQTGTITPDASIHPRREGKCK